MNQPDDGRAPGIPPTAWTTSDHIVPCSALETGTVPSPDAHREPPAKTLDVRTGSAREPGTQGSRGAVGGRLRWSLSSAGIMTPALWKQDQGPGEPRCGARLELPEVRHLLPPPCTCSSASLSVTSGLPAPGAETLSPDSPHSGRKWCHLHLPATSGDTPYARHLTASRFLSPGTPHGHLPHRHPLDTHGHPTDTCHTGPPWDTPQTVVMPGSPGHPTVTC